MELIAEVVAWFTDPASWTGRNGIPIRLWEHVSLSAASLAVAVGLGLPLGLFIGHTNRGSALAIGLSNVGRAVPSLGWIGIVLPFSLALGLGLGFWPSLIALVLLAIPPIVTNAYAGLREVDRDTIEAGRGMGMREFEVLARVEIPLALPVILAGVRTSAVQVVATATLAAVISGGTLGHLILQGFLVQDDGRLVGAAILTALLAILTELGFAALQRSAVSPGLGVRTTWNPTQPAQVGRGGGDVAF
ncbi:MAG: ABC transporter permease [Candidatus Limnocylindria bacterium]